MTPNVAIQMDYLDASRPPPREPPFGPTAKLARLFRISQAACECLDHPQRLHFVPEDLLR